jgi:hypothetical protein
MGHYQIPYHKSLLSLDIPDGNVHYYIDLKFPNTKKNNIQILTDAINRSESNSLHEFVNQKRVGLIIEDATRDVPLEDLLEASAPDLQMAQSVTVFIATGTHDGDNDGNHTIIDLVLRSQKKYSFALDNIIVNDCHSDSFYLAGIT